MSTALPQISIIDDDPSVRNALARLFETSPYQTETYSSADHFLESLAKRRPACLVVDLQMPKMTGIELHAHLNRIGIRIPTILITAYDEPGVQEKCTGIGISYFFLKPIRRARLMGAVSELIGEVASP